MHDRNQSWNPLLHSMPPTVYRAQPNEHQVPGLTLTGTTQSASTLPTLPRPQSDSAYLQNYHASDLEHHRHKRTRSHYGVDQTSTLFSVNEQPSPLLNAFDQNFLHLTDPVADLVIGGSYFDAAQQQPTGLDADILLDDGLMSQLAELFEGEPIVEVPSSETTEGLFTKDELESIKQGNSRFSAVVWNDPTPPPGFDSETLLYTSDQDLSEDGSHKQEVILTGLGMGVSTKSARAEKGKEQTLPIRSKRAGLPNDDEG